MEVLKTIKKLIKKDFDFTGVDVTEEASLIDDLGFDSLDSVELAIALEDEFEVELPDEFILNVKTVGDIGEHITKNVGE